MSAGSDLLMLGRVTMSLLVVLTVVVVAGRLMRRAGGGIAGSTVRVRARVGLTREASLAVVEIGDSALVLGVTPSSVRLLTSMDVTALASAVDPTVAEPGSFERAPGTGRFDTGRFGTGRPTLRQLMESLRDRTARR